MQLLKKLSLIGERPLALALALAAAACIAGGKAEPFTIYVSPLGNDSWSGRLASSTANEDDGPFASLSHAMQTARKARQAGVGEDGITIILRGGNYFLSEPLVLTPEDSGVSTKAPFTIEAYQDEKPVLHSGQLITGWKKSAARPGVWKAEVPSVRNGQWYFRSLFVNGLRATRARTPNAGFFRMVGKRFHDNPVQFKFKPGDLRPEWAENDDVELIAFEKWTDFRQHIRKINVVENVLTLSGSAKPHTREIEARYFVENTSDALDTPGEWYLDRKTGVVSYMPREGEDLANVEVIAPRLHELVRLQGDFTTKKAVHHVVLRKLTFRFTDWTMTDEGYYDRQAAVDVAGDLVAEGATDCVVEDCTFSQLAGYAMDFGKGCQHNRIVGNEIVDIGAGGVRLGETAKRIDRFELNHSNVVTDNHIHEVGVIYSPAVGVLILQSSRNRIAHNHIHHLFYSAVSVGWTWGYQESPCYENVVEFNYIHDIGQNMLSDMGGIYTLGPQHGTLIRNNLIQDVEPFTYGGWGLYTDAGSTDIVLENNVVYYTKSGGFHQNYGRNNVVRNNLFAFGRENQLMRTLEETHVSFFFTNNIVYFDSGNLLGGNWKNDHFVMNWNLYFDARPNFKPDELKFEGASLAEWHRRGHEEHSLIADPEFVAPEKNDFRLKPTSPAFKLGFKPIDLSTVGVRPQTERTD
jgi:hypothetical protein